MPPAAPVTTATSSCVSSRVIRGRVASGRRVAFDSAWYRGHWPAAFEATKRGFGQLVCTSTIPETTSPPPTRRIQVTGWVSKPTRPKWSMRMEALTVPTTTADT